jgi:phage tail-like protein
MATARTIFRSHWTVAGIAAVMFIIGGGRLMSVATQPDLPRYSFAVTIEGRALGAFLEVTGLDVELEVLEFRDGSGELTRKLPGQTKYGDIVLKRGIDQDVRLQDWFNEFSASRTERVDGTILLFDQSHSEVARWNFVNAWPSKVTGPTLSTHDREVAIESITLVHEGLTRVLR